MFVFSLQPCSHLLGGGGLLASCMWFYCVLVTFQCGILDQVWCLNITGGGLLASCMWFYCVLVTFQCGILDQVWCLIVTIPVICLLSYFETL